MWVLYCKCFRMKLGEMGGKKRKEIVESNFFICFSCKLKWQQGGQLSLIEIQGIPSPRHSVSSTVFL